MKTKIEDKRVAELTAMFTSGQWPKEFYVRYAERTELVIRKPEHPAPPVTIRILGF